MTYKRRALIVLIALVFILVCLGGCNNSAIDEGQNPYIENGENGNEEQQEVNLSEELGVSVNFIDVGRGEAIFVYLPDGKTLLVDCGKNDTDAEKIIKVVKAFKVDKIDYLLLSHPDTEHIGGAEKLINTITVGKAFITKIMDDKILSLFPTFEKVKKLLTQQEVTVKDTDSNDYIKGEDYEVAVLTPPKRGGIYADFHLTLSPTENQVNDVSPIVYLDVKGVRFLLTGDAGKSQENAIIENVNNGIYDKEILAVKGLSIDLQNIDFLKVSNGGKDGATTTEFLNIIKPKNAVVFAGEGSTPENLVLRRLQLANEFYDLYRTDVYGSIAVKLLGNGEYQIISEKE